jgi:lipopolysaccharide transport system permease protein
VSSPPRVGTWIPSRDLLITLIERKLRLLTKRSWVGFTYPIIAPVFLFTLYIFVFHQVFKTPIHDYPIYLFSGLLPWTFVAQTLPDSITSLSAEADLIRRSNFRYELLPIASVSALSFHFLVALTGFIIVLAAVGHLNPVVLPLLVIPVMCLYLLVTTISMILALIDVYNRDIRRFLGNFLTIWFFLVPIVYGQAQVKSLDFLRYVDPVNILVSEFRAILYYQSFPAVHTLFEGLIICAGLFAGSIVVYRRFDDRLPREV